MNKKLMILSLAIMGISPLMAQSITTNDVELDCGQVVFNSPVTADFQLRNNSTATMVIDKVKVGCGCTKVEYPKHVSAGGVFLVSVTYDARQMGHFNKEVRVYANGETKPVDLMMKGVVVEEIIDYSGSYPFNIDGLLIDKNDLEFDDVNRGDRPVQKFHIMNSTEKVVQPQLMHLPPYIKASVSPTRISPGRKGEAVLTLDSKLLHDYGLTQTSIFLGLNPGDKVAPEKEITMSAVLLPEFDSTMVASAPKMELSEKDLNLGSFGRKSKLKGTIDITNKGMKTLSIQALQMFTIGLEVSLNKTEIAPGETAKLKITADAEGIRKARSKPRVLMITNDPKASKVVININTK